MVEQNIIRPAFRANLELPRLGEVHLWPVHLDCSSEDVRILKELLSSSEQDRAARFRFDTHRNLYIAGKAALRCILSAYLDCKPEAIRFEIGAAGKPSLAPPGPLRIEFNVSHCEDRALVAVTAGIPVGVDIERIRAIDDAADLVNRFFSSREARIFNFLEKAHQHRAFFNLWTRKEALLKATGEGIAHSLNQVEVSFHTGDPARIVALPPAFGRVEDWTLEAPESEPGFTAAVAVQSANAIVRRMPAFSMPLLEMCAAKEIL